MPKKVCEFVDLSSRNVMQQNRIEVSEDFENMEHFVDGALRAQTAGMENVLNYCEWFGKDETNFS